MAILAAIATASAALALTACSDSDGDADTATPSVSAPVTADGVRLEAHGVVVTGPAGVAPEGTTLTLRPTSLPGELPEEVSVPLTAPIDLSLDGRQPVKPLSVTFPLAVDAGPPPAPETIAVLTVPSDGSDPYLLPVTVSNDGTTATAQISHLSGFALVRIDFAAIGRRLARFFQEATGVTAARPDCVGQPATLDDGTTVTLPGEFGEDDRPVAWPCVRAEQHGGGVGEVLVQLASNSPLPWRVRAAPDATLEPVGDVNLTNAAVLAGYQQIVQDRPFAEGLLAPGGSLSYRFDTAALPGRVELQADAGIHLALVFGFAVELVASLFGANLRLLEDAGVFECLLEAASLVPVGSTPAADKIGAVGRAVVTCAKAIATGLLQFALLVASAGVAVFVGALEGAVRTAFGTDRVEIQVDVNRPASACPPEEGTCVGIREGGTGPDVDGDGRADGVGVTYRELTNGAGFDGLRDAVGVHVVLADGRQISARANAVSTIVQLIGATDVDGDGRDEVFVVVGGGAHTMSVVPFEYRDGTLQRGAGEVNMLTIDGAINYLAGFTCRAGAGGQAELLVWGATNGSGFDGSPPVYRGSQTLFAADASGVLRRGQTQDVSYVGSLTPNGTPQPPDDANALAGANCPGLDRWP